MIGLDSNILVRYLTQDDPVQSPKVNALIERRLSNENPGFISVVAAVETVWVLGNLYEFNPIEIAAAIEDMMESRSFSFEHAASVFLAMTALEQGADFADALIGSLGLRAGCTYTLTFDKKARRLPGFELLT